ncbi:MAG: PP2C family protein-serine/threonine phosphatase [Planctomycetota bacterium]|jgi:sigma-B regulation protein RsbU (phosphoserine phosphatase)
MTVPSFSDKTIPMVDDAPDTPARILVVDDDEMNRDMLSRRLERKGYAVSVACDGREALEHVDREPWDAVLLDIMMPVMDGIEALKILRQTHPPTELPVIMATAKAQSEDVAGALRQGANDYVTKPLDFQVVLARLETQIELKRSIEKITSLERSLAERNALLEHANTRMSRDLEAAASIQRSMLPSNTPRCDAARFAWVYRPCDELAGDALNILPLGDNLHALYVLDVTGHGVAASLLSVSLMRSLTPRDDHASITTHPGNAGRYQPTAPQDVARQLNIANPMSIEHNQFATFVYGVLDCATKTFTYTAAGHPAPVVLHKNQPAESHDLPALPIGVDPDAAYAQHVVQLAPGDRVCLYSDGAVEEVNADHQQFSRERLGHLLEELRETPIEEAVNAITEAIGKWRGGEPFADDISILAFEML